MRSDLVVTENISSLLDEIQSRFRAEEPFIGPPRSSPRPRLTAMPQLTAMLRPVALPSVGIVKPLVPSTAPVSTAKILVVDDEPLNVRICQKYLRELGYAKTRAVTDPILAMDAILEDRPDLIVLDLMMPVVSGLDLMQWIRSHSELAQIPVLILSAATDRETRLAALNAGASDFLTKPLDPHELAPRIRNALTIKRYQDQMRDYAKTLEEAVHARTADLEASRLEVLHCLSRAVEYRDDHMGRHVERVGRYAGIIARSMGLDASFCRDLAQAAQLHDIGKIGIPDEVLMKPSRLTPDEYERVQKHAAVGKRILEPRSDLEADRVLQHVQIGSRILDVPKSPLLSMASRIALTHHEKWDGSGYPSGLAGEDIPLEGRITAVADVFDALSSRRPYKPAIAVEVCFEIMEHERGSHFDPKAIDGFFAQREAIIAVKNELADPD